MFGEFLNIIFKSIKLDKTLYSDNKNFTEASIYFGGALIVSPIYSMSTGFLIVICIIIAIALIIFPLFISYKAQKNRKNKN